MKKALLMISVVIAMVFFLVACSKKERGVCYCKYANGEKKEFDLSAVPRPEAKDSCALISSNASHFEVAVH